MADSKLKLIYFNIPGRAEVSRLVLVCAGKEFDDVRITGLQWKDLKPTMPFGTIPVLEVDGQLYSQSKAIAAFLAKEFGLYGETNLERLQIDQIMYLMEDLIQEYGQRYFFEKDEEKKIEGAKYLQAEVCPRFLGYFEKMLQDNGTDYIVGDKLSVADLTVFDMYTGFLGPFIQTSIDSFPLVKRLVETVRSNERISAYMAKKQ